jgi:hypothetical protein
VLLAAQSHSFAWTVAFTMVQMGMDVAFHPGLAGSGMLQCKLLRRPAGVEYVFHCCRLKLLVMAFARLRGV